MTSKLGTSCAAVILAICASMALLRDGHTERPRNVSYVSRSAGVFQIDLNPTDAFNMDASKDWNRNSTKAERSANAPPNAWAMVLNVYKMLFSIDGSYRGGSIWIHLTPRFPHA